jgi:tRNA (guanine-N7-)-methyltransferase
LNRPVRSFVLRQGRTTPAQQRALEELLPKYGIPFPQPIAPGKPFVLEIGSGMGETTSQLAAAAPELNYVAVEVYDPGLGQLMLRAEKLGVENLRLLHGDAVVLLTEHVEPGTLHGVRLFFPDPWPKKKHHKRRLVQPEFVRLLATRLRPGGTLHLATDWENYAEQMLEVCSAEPALKNRYDGWAPRPEWRPVTKFEQRADVEGRVSLDLIFEKR